MNIAPKPDPGYHFASAGVEFGVILLVFTGLGYLADVHLGTLPIGLLVGLGVGFAGALWRLVRKVRPGQTNDAPASDRPDDTP
jgi:F0F1-type ATP synthase assembly protein I